MLPCCQSLRVDEKSTTSVRKRKATSDFFWGGVIWVELVMSNNFNKNHEWGWCFFFFFSMLGNMAFFFFSTVWTLCLQMFIEVDKGEVSTVKRCYTWASPAMEAVTPGAGGAYWKVWPWWGAAAQPLEAVKDGWMLFFFAGGGKGLAEKSGGRCWECHHFFCWNEKR